MSVVAAVVVVLLAAGLGFAVCAFLAACWIMGQVDEADE